MEKPITKTPLFRMLAFLIFFIGAGLLLSPLIREEYRNNVYFGALLIVLNLAFILVLHHKAAKMDAKKASLYYAWMLLAATCFLELLPNAVLMQFSDGPDQKILEAHSYLSLFPLAWAMLYPSLTVIATAVLVIRLYLAFYQNKSILYLNGYDLFFHILIVLLSFSMLPRYGVTCLSISNCGVAILSAAHLVLILFVKRYAKKNVSPPSV